MFLAPFWFSVRAYDPKAVFASPDSLLFKDSNPTAELTVPVVLRPKDEMPKAVLLFILPPPFPTVIPFTVIWLLNVLVPVTV